MNKQEKKQLSLYIENIVRKTINEANKHGNHIKRHSKLDVYHNESDDERSALLKKKNKEEKTNTEKNAKANRRAKVISYLKDPKTNCAEYMRQLWHPSASEEDSKRGYFYKCRDGELDDNGNPYAFSEDDITTLYSIIFG